MYVVTNSTFPSSSGKSLQLAQQRITAKVRESKIRMVPSGTLLTLKGSHGGKYEEYALLCCNNVQFRSELFVL
jgi:hypothetical protein